MNLHALPAFTDNYIWWLDNGDSAWVVDPGDPEPVLSKLEATGARLEGILVTHHHFDHIGGLDRLRSETHCRIIGPTNPAIAAIEERVQDGDTVEVLGNPFVVMAVPGHTLDHIAFYSEAAGILFCGDTLFAAGCGRMFEGTPSMMHASLERLAALPADTRVCCTHEYTLANLAFARAVEPDSAPLATREAACIASRKAGQPTLPSTIEIERSTNPFLRTDAPAILASLDEVGRLDGTGPAEVFGALRRWKDDF